jgi:hypothetical protein
MTTNSPFEFVVGFAQMKKAYGEEKSSPCLPLLSRVRERGKKKEITERQEKRG